MRRDGLFTVSRVLASASRAVLMWCGVLSLAACTGGVSSTDTTGTVTASQFTVGVTVTGLSGSNLVLQNNSGDNLSIPADGSFTFATALIRGDSYSVTVLSEPTAPTQTCVVTNGSGTVGTADVTGIGVACSDKTTTTDTIGGTAAGVLGTGLVLQNNNGDNLAVSTNGPFTFAAPLASGAAYAVSVLSPPINPYQNCVIANGAGTTGSANVTNVAVSCTTNPNTAYTIGGTASGVSGAGSVVLQDNGRDNLTVSADGPFTFAIPIPSGSTYNVTSLQVNGQQSQTCTFTNASGTVAASNVTNVSVVCKANVVVSATVSGLSGSGLVLQDNGGDNLGVSKSGPAAFATALVSGTPYKVTVLTQPTAPSQNCVVTNGTGTATAGQATGVVVTCTTIRYTVGGSVSGLAGTGLVLQNNAADNFNVTGTGTVPFTFSTPIPSGGPYNVSVLTQPIAPYQQCTVNNGAGNVQAGNVTGVSVACTTNSYTVGGTVSGLPLDPTTGLPVTGLSLTDNNGAPYPITTGNAAFTLPGTVNSEATYSVTITAEPAGVACAVASGTGTVVNTAVTNVVVTCSQIGNYLYVTNGGGNNISGFAIDANTGALEPLTEIVAPAGQPNAIIATTDVHPSSIVAGCYLEYDESAGYYPESLYVANSVSQTVSAFAVDSSTASPGGGSLSLITNPPIAAGTTPDYVDFAQFQCAAFALNSGSSNVSGYLADTTTGALTAAPGNPFATAGTGSVPVAAANATTTQGSAPSATYEYVASQVTNNVSAYSVGATGALTFITDPAAPITNPIAAGTNPSAVVTDALTVTVNAVSFDVPYVYVANQGSNNIFVYEGSVNDGSLTQFGGPVATGNGPTAMVVVLQELLYVANGTDNTISAYSITTSPTANTGTLTPLGLTVAAGTKPVALTQALVGNNQYVFAVNNQSNDVYVYQVTTATGGALPFGTLTLVGKYAVGTAPTSVAVPVAPTG
jgi:6-phosphogluconolactonase (cycloisomerase 2 family)